MTQKHTTTGNGENFLDFYWLSEFYKIISEAHSESQKKIDIDLHTILISNKVSIHTKSINKICLKLIAH
jgi:hypothetical protein